MQIATVIAASAAHLREGVALIVRTDQGACKLIFPHALAQKVGPELGLRGVIPVGEKRPPVGIDDILLKKGPCG